MKAIEILKTKNPFLEKDGGSAYFVTKEVLEAMEEYASKQAVEFADELINNIGNNIWIRRGEGSFYFHHTQMKKRNYTTQELYNLFIGQFIC